jgi:hypothetical protein
MTGTIPLREAGLAGREAVARRGDERGVDARLAAVARVPAVPSVVALPGVAAVPGVPDVPGVTHVPGAAVAARALPVGTRGSEDDQGCALEELTATHGPS